MLEFINSLYLGVIHTILALQSFLQNTSKVLPFSKRRIVNVLSYLSTKNTDDTDETSYGLSNSTYIKLL